MKKKLMIPNKIILLFAFSIILLNCISAVEVSLNYSTSSIVQLKTLKYEPYPVNPGEYFDFWVSVQYNGNAGASGATFELVPEYPFSLDENESATQTFGGASPSVVLKYKIRVNEDAVEGTNILKLNYKVGSNWYTKEFEIKVANAQTDFDAIIQDSTSSEVSIAIANTGKNTANSVIVKIPEQDYFESTGTDGQMVGNLESGDYSIVSFEISQKMAKAPIKEGTEENSQGFPTMGSSQTQNLTFDIYYTDTIGERRVVTMQLPLSLSSTNSTAMGMMGPGGRNNQGSSWIVWAIVGGVILALVIVSIIILKKKPKLADKIKNKFSKLFHKKKTEENKIPDWIKNSKEKNK
jgi:hypothetical protein